MNEKITKFQSRLFAKLFSTNPTVIRFSKSTNKLNLDKPITHFYSMKNEPFWYAKGEKGNKIVYIFSIKNKPLKDITQDDATLILDFDKDNQFNNTALGLFNIKNFKIHVLINYNILKKRYPYFKTDSFKIKRLKSLQNDTEFKVIDLGALNEEFIENLEKLIKLSSEIEIFNERDFENNDTLNNKEEEEKLKKEFSKQNSVNPYDEIKPPTNKRNCKICGRKLNDKTKKNICKRCQRKQYATKILLKLLKSVEPEKSFKKEDLKVLGLQSIQIKDYIWTLKEHNLLTEDNNKLQLKNRKELEIFIKESGLEMNEIPNEEPTTKLNKTCKTCGETLEISKFFTSTTTKDGFEDNCKDCKRLITTAKYLKEITSLIEYETEFKEDELKSHFKNSIELQGKIWALLDNDLLKKDFDTNTYTLTNEKTANKFLDKYYVEKSEQLSEESANKNSVEHTKNDQMNIVIKALHNGKSRIEAAELANIPIYKIDHWYSEGREGYDKDNVNFYKELKKLEEKNKYKTNSTNNSETKEQEYERKATNRKLFLDNIKTGKNKEESSINADIDLSLINEWYLKGKNHEEPYVEFYEEYIEIKNNSNLVTIPKIKNTSKFENRITINKMNIILEALANGKNEKDAIKEANISEDIYNYWYNKGKLENGEIYTQFNSNVNKLKGKNNIITTPSNKEEDKLNELLTPLDEKYEICFISSKMNRTGIAWVNIIGKKWVYQKSDKKLSNSNIYELYQEVKNNNLPWGVRDLNLAKPIILKNYELKTKENIKTPENYPPSTDEENIDKINEDIYAPLDKKYYSKFNPNMNNKTGIAWVNKSGNKWIYQRQRNGKQIRFNASDIHELHKKVISNKQIWGIIDLKKAKQIIESDNDINESKPIITTSNVTVIYIEKFVNLYDVLIKGYVKNNELINILNRIDLFEENIKRIITTSTNNQADIFIELNLNKNDLIVFEEKINDLGWKINK